MKEHFRCGVIFSDGLDKLIGPTEDDDDMLFVTQQGTTCTTSKLPQVVFSLTTLVFKVSAEVLNSFRFQVPKSPF